MICHQHLHAECPGAGHAIKAGNAVVDCDQYVGAKRFDPVGNGGCQAVAVCYAVGYEVADFFCAE